MSERRRFPRVHADVVCRPAGARAFHSKRNTSNVSLGGVRVFSDEDHRIGERLDLDVLLPGGEPVRCWAQVVWRSALNGDAPARFDLGLQFIDMAATDIQRLATVLRPAG